MGTVTSLSDYRNPTTTEYTYSKAVVGSDDVIISISASGDKPNYDIVRTESLNPVRTESLYPASNDLRPELAKAFELLTEGISLLEKSILSFEDNDLISSDDYTNRCQALLPELFCCRSLSEGFSSIINATFHSIANLQGLFLDKVQLTAIRNILRRLYSEPFIGIDEAVDEIISLEDTGLECEPNHFKYIADLLDE